METPQNSFKIISQYRTEILGFAALWVFHYHLHQFVFHGSSTLVFVERFVKRIGFCGVDIFFLLSGYGLPFSLEHSTVMTFYLRRVKRLAPSVCIIACIRSYVEKWSTKQLVFNVLGINFYTKYIYTFLWFVPAIMTLYLVFPLYAEILKLNGNTQAIIWLTLILWMFMSIHFRNDLRKDFYGFTNRIPVFLVGILVSHLSRYSHMKFNQTDWITIYCIFLLGLFLAYVVLWQHLPLIVNDPQSFLPNVLMSFSLCFIIPNIFENLLQNTYINPVIRGLQTLLQFYGRHSLELYTLQEFFGHRMVKRMNQLKVDSRIQNVVLIVILTGFSVLESKLIVLIGRIVEGVNQQLKRVVQERK